MLLHKSSKLAVTLIFVVASSVDIAAFVISPSISFAPRAAITQLFAEEESKGSDDILNSPAFLKRKVEILKADIEKADADIEAENALLAEVKEEFTPDIERLEREFSHVRARSYNETTSADERSAVIVATAVLDSIDNFDRALSSIKCETDAEKEVRTKYQAVLEKVSVALGEIGAVPIETVGQEFDYEMHEAITQMPMEGFEEGTVCMEYVRGYKIGDRLVRPAKVVVAA